MSEQGLLLDEGPSARHDDAAVPLFGTTAEAHVRKLMAGVDDAVPAVFGRIRNSRRLSVGERDELSRRLAGVVADCETIRIWLAAGAPR